MALSHDGVLRAAQDKAANIPVIFEQTSLADVLAATNGALRVELADVKGQLQLMKAERDAALMRTVALELTVAAACEENPQLQEKQKELQEWPLKYKELLERYVALEAQCKVFKEKFKQERKEHRKSQNFMAGALLLSPASPHRPEGGDAAPSTSKAGTTSDAGNNALEAAATPGKEQGMGAAGTSQQPAKKRDQGKEGGDFTFPLLSPAGTGGPLVQGVEGDAGSALRAEPRMTGRGASTSGTQVQADQDGPLAAGPADAEGADGGAAAGGAAGQQQLPQQQQQPPPVSPLPQEQLPEGDGAAEAGAVDEVEEEVADEPVQEAEQAHFPWSDECIASLKAARAEVLPAEGVLPDVPLGVKQALGLPEDQAHRGLLVSVSTNSLGGNPHHAYCQVLGCPVVAENASWAHALYATGYTTSVTLKGTVKRGVSGLCNKFANQYEVPLVTDDSLLRGSALCVTSTGLVFVVRLGSPKGKGKLPNSSKVWLLAVEGAQAAVPSGQGAETLRLCDPVHEAQRRNYIERSAKENAQRKPVSLIDPSGARAPVVINDGTVVTCNATHRDEYIKLQLDGLKEEGGQLMSSL